METGYKFTIKRQSGIILTIESNDEDLGLFGLVNLFEEFAAAAGFSQRSIDQYIRYPDVNSPVKEG